MIFRQSTWVTKLYFATQAQGAQSIAGITSYYSIGHRPPALADTAAGRYAGSLFTSASRSEALQSVLTDLHHLQKVIQSDANIKLFLKNSAIKRAHQK